MNPILLDLPMPIETPRLLIRPFQVGDGAILNAAIHESFAELHRFMAWAKVKPSLEESEEQARLAAANWILKKNEEPWLSLLIFEKANNQMVGATAFHSIDWQIPSLATGYWLKTASVGHGFMTEAVNALTIYTFKQLNIKRIEITCAIDNGRSKKIPERLGYTLEATLKAHRRKPLTDELTDTLLFARTSLEGLSDAGVNW